MLDYVVEIKGVVVSKQNDGVSSGKFFRNRLDADHYVVNGRRLNHVRISRRTSAPKPARSFATWTAGDSRASPVFFL